MSNGILSKKQKEMLKSIPNCKSEIRNPKSKTNSNIKIPNFIETTMPWINIDYDNAKVSDVEVQALARAIQQIVSSETKIEDVFVYANSAHIKVNIAPIEVVVKISSQKIEDRKKLFYALKSRILVWKKENSFQHPINLTLQPMDWKFETGL